jgi:hypothetical protein
VEAQTRVTQASISRGHDASQDKANVDEDLQHDGHTDEAMNPQRSATRPRRSHACGGLDPLSLPVAVQGFEQPAHGEHPATAKAPPASVNQPRLLHAEMMCA